MSRSRPDRPAPGVVHAAVAALALLVLAGCGPAAPEPAGTPEPSGPPPLVTDPAQFDQELHDELIAMFERDQSGRMGGPDPEGDRARAQRLEEILDEHNWPTFALVGEDGEDAAWAIAQHADLDPGIQAYALELLREAVAVGQASPGNLAYLEDRVALNAGRPQVYGTQAGCGDDGTPALAPVEDEADLDARRASVGLPPIAEYLAELAPICAAEAG